MSTLIIWYIKFCWAVITNYHELGGLKCWKYILLHLEAKIKALAVFIPFGSPNRESVPCFSWLLVTDQQS